MSCFGIVHLSIFLCHSRCLLGVLGSVLPLSSRSLPYNLMYSKVFRVFSLGGHCEIDIFESELSQVNSLFSVCPFLWLVLLVFQATEIFPISQSNIYPFNPLSFLFQELCSKPVRIFSLPELILKALPSLLSSPNVHSADLSFWGLWPQVPPNEKSFSWLTWSGPPLPRNQQHYSG